MSAMLPSFSLSGSSQSDNTFAHRASLACLASPLVVFGLSYVFGMVSHKFTGHNLAVATLAHNIVSCILAAFGLIMGILALLLMKPGGRARIVIFSLGGLAFTGLFAAIYVPNFVRARTAAVSDSAAVDSALAASKAANQTAAASLKTNEPSVSVAPYSPASDQAARTNSNEIALRMKANQAYVARWQALRLALQTASSNLTSARVLSVRSNLNNRNTIQERAGPLWKSFSSATRTCRTSPAEAKTTTARNWSI